MIEVRTPGRVNLIGEHTDYNDGFVMPAAIGYYTVVHARPRTDREVMIRSDRFGQPALFTLGALPRARRGDWTDYARGILIELEQHGATLHGAALDVTATLPIGAGLSSSASFEISIALAMLAVSGITMDPTELALLAQRSEHEHVGIRAGIMDQFAVLCARAGHVLMLDTRSLAVDHVPFGAGARLIVANTMVKHALASSEYNQRRAQCEEGVALMQRRFPEIRALRDVSLEMLERCKADLPEVIYRRCRHVVSEDARVLDAAVALREANFPRLGRLMDESHASLKNDYEVSCVELDALVEIAQRLDGCYGARMTGGGFGGCTVNLVAAASADAFAAALADGYRRATSITPDLYDGTPAAGAHVAS
ncbi:MAG TPA: galactokinase [Candidatus Baltobacteraceae bacterium]|nr:galactokinase [Candidatus Baltobacteraceae bacterium]